MATSIKQEQVTQSAILEAEKQESEKIEEELQEAATVEETSASFGSKYVVGETVSTVKGTGEITAIQHYANGAVKEYFIQSGNVELSVTEDEILPSADADADNSVE